MRWDNWRLVVLGVLGVRVQPGQPGGKPVDGGLELRVEVDEVPQSLDERRGNEQVSMSWLAERR